MKKTTLIVSVLLAFFLVAPVALGQPIVIKLGDSVEPNHPHAQSWFYFAERVEDLSDGQMIVEVYPQSILGDHIEMLRGLQMGTIEMTKTSNAAFSTFVEETMVFDLPYLFRDKEHFVTVMNSEIAEEFLKEIYPEYGFYGLFFTDSGSRSLYNAVRPIHSPEDLQGLSIRVMESAIMIDTLNAMGSMATPLSLAELYSALRQGVIDGAENSPPFYKAQNHHEVAPYLSLTDHFMSPCILLVSSIFWETLDEWAQNIILEAAADTKEYQYRIWAEDEGKVLDELRALGVEINEVEKEPFIESVEPVYEKHAQRYLDVIERIRDL